MADHVDAWFRSGGNPNHQPAPAKAAKGKKSLEPVRYTLEDKYKRQSDEIDQRTERLINLFNTVAEARYEVQQMKEAVDSKAYKKDFVKKKITFALEKLGEAGVLRAEILGLGGKAPAIPSDLNRKI